MSGIIGISFCDFRRVGLGIRAVYQRTLSTEDFFNLLIEVSRVTQELAAVKFEIRLGFYFKRISASNVVVIFMAALSTIVVSGILSI